MRAIQALLSPENTHCRVLHCGIKELRAESQGFSLTHQISVLRHRDGLFFNPVAWAAMTDFNGNTLRPDPTVLLSW